MKLKVEKIEKNLAELEVEVSSETFEQSVQKAYIKMKGRFNIPGFRKGKAPRKIIETYYGKEVFYEEAVNIAISQTYPESIKEADITPVSQPEFELVTVEPLVYKAKVYTKPEVELGQYIGIEVEKPDFSVKEEDVDNELKRIQEQNARLVAVQDRPIKKDDIAIIDFTGYIDDIPFEGGSGTDYSLTIGSGTFIPGFEDQLIGANKGDEVEVKVKFPEDYRNSDLAGKDSIFKVTIKEIKEKELSAIDDEFAKDVSEFDTLEELKADIRKKMEESAKNLEKRELNNRVIKEVVKNAQVDIPQVMIDNEIEVLINEFAQRLQYQGMNLEYYMGISDLTKEQLAEQFKTEAIDRIKTMLVMEKIQQVENIEVTEEDLDKEYEKMAESMKQDVEKIKKRFAGERQEYLKENLAIEKTVNFLVEKSIIK